MKSPGILLKETTSLFPKCALIMPFLAELFIFLRNFFYFDLWKCAQFISSVSCSAAMWKMLVWAINLVIKNAFITFSDIFDANLIDL